MSTNTLRKARQAELRHAIEKSEEMAMLKQWLLPLVLSVSAGSPTLSLSRVDMATPGPYRALAARMNRLLDEIEALEKQ